MSNDQLSWDQFLKGAESQTNEAPVTEKKSTRKSKKEAVTAPDTASEPQLLYSKKNWSKLDLSTKSDNSESSSKGRVTTSTPEPLKVSEPPAQVASERPKPVASESVKNEEPVRFDARPERNKAQEDEIADEVQEPQVLTVSELNKSIREILEGTFSLLWIKGEISNFKAHTSGHFYFSLKDSKAQVNAVMFRGFNTQLRFRPEDGMEVLVRGKVTVYEPRGNYQIFCELMEPVGAGALQKAFEQLKAKLQKEGLFDEARKRPLPALPKHIAIVTSPTGAAIRDMLNVLGRRFKGVNITVIPCKVQGDQAPGEIVAAIQQANRLQDLDVMIVGRGGGSIEDLWAFNDERVARAIASTRVPVISAVGHEIDFTIADFVADLRAPTPSAAAELVVKNAADLSERVRGLARSLKMALLTRLNQSRQQVFQLSRRLVDPKRRIQDASQRCDELLQRLELAIRRMIERKSDHLARNVAVLDSLSPLKVLDRGYSMVVSGQEVVTDAKRLKVGQVVTVRMGRGSIEAEVKKIEEPKR